jgi:hypothetical protein
MKAAVYVQKCTRNRRPFGVRIQQMGDGDWWRTWSFEIDDRRAAKEGYDATQVQGNLYCVEEFPGCPYCGTFGFVQCNACGRFSCWNNEKQMTCPWCSKELRNIVVAKDKFSLSGGDL